MSVSKSKIKAHNTPSFATGKTAPEDFSEPQEENAPSGTTPLSSPKTKIRTKNKGECGELYAFARILAEGSIPIVKSDLSPTKALISFRKLHRNDNGPDDDKGKRYDIIETLNSVWITRDDSQGVMVDQADIQMATDSFLQTILSSNTVRVDDPTLLELLKLLDTDKISAPSADKSDFHALTTSANSSLPASMGFSVKCFLGGPPTLVNANHEKSALRFEVLFQGIPANKQQIDTLLRIQQQSPSRLRSENTFSHLRQHDGMLRFVATRGDQLAKNLKLIDGDALDVLALLLLERYWTNNMNATLEELIDTASKENGIARHPFLSELNYDSKKTKKFLRIKMANILMQFTTGATVSREWDGRAQAAGGFIIVEPDGEVVCLEHLNPDETRNFLLSHTHFETPSTKRHFSGFYEEGQKLYFDGQFQVRLKL